MSEIDKTAEDKLCEFLVQRSPNDWAQIYPAALPTSLEKGFDPLKGISLSVPSLQALARLWLMRGEIRGVLELYGGDLWHNEPPEGITQTASLTGTAHPRTPAAELLAKLSDEALGNPPFTEADIGKRIEFDNIEDLNAFANEGLQALGKEGE